MIWESLLSQALQLECKILVWGPCRHIAKRAARLVLHGAPLKRIFERSAPFHTSSLEEPRLIKAPTFGPRKDPGNISGAMRSWHSIVRLLSWGAHVILHRTSLHTWGCFKHFACRIMCHAKKLRVFHGCLLSGDHLFLGNPAERKS